MTTTPNTDDGRITNTAVSNTDSATVSKSKIYPNLLNNYTSYTSLISFQVATPANYNLMVENEKYIPENWQVICQSGGVGPNKATPDNGATHYFTSDLFIDNFEMECVVGLNQENRGSNVTQVEWDIVEPHGMDFIENLYDFCEVMGESNYCQLPYLLKITFKGFLDDGTSEIIPGVTKYIPIHLLNMEVKLQNAGSVYKVTAIPYNESANLEANGRVDSAIETWGTTVDNFCDLFVKALNDNQASYVKDGQYLIPDNYEIEVVELTTSETSDESNIDIGGCEFINPAVSKTFVAKDAKMDDPPTVNNQNNVSNMVAKIKGNIDPNSFYTTTVAVKQTNGTTANVAVNSATTTGGALTVSNKATVNGVLTNENAVRFNAGSSIIDCLSALIMNSTYITSQITEYQKKVSDIIDMANDIGANANDDDDIKEAIAKLNYPFQWFMIIPKVTLLDYDKQRGCYARNFLFRIQPYMVDNAKILAVPNQVPDLRVVKEYNYILTGKNTEVLSFDMEFKMSFITYAQGNKNTKPQATGSPTPAKEQSPTPNSSQNGYALVVDNNHVNSGHFQVAAPDSAKSVGTAGEQTPERSIAADVAATIYAPAEMLTVSLKINGDPDYIKQDGIFINPVAGDTLQPYIEPVGNTPGGIQFNCGEIFMNLNFLVPRDLDEETGLLIPIAGKTMLRRNSFSGAFKVLRVVNKINKGVFTQDLEVIRNDDSHKLKVDNTTVTFTDSTVATTPAASTAAAPSATPKPSKATKPTIATPVASYKTPHIGETKIIPAKSNTGMNPNFWKGF